MTARILQFQPRAEQPAATAVAGDLPPIDPMRVLSTLVCKGCRHEWVQPAAGGNCPQCHSPRTECVDTRVTHAKRV